MSLFLFLPILFFLLLLQGFFSGSEMALVASNKIRIHHQASLGSAVARRFLKAWKRPQLLLATCLVGTNVALVTNSVLTASFLAGFLIEKRFIVDHGEGLGAVLVPLLLTPLTITFGETIPKALFLTHADRLALVVIRPLRILSLLLAPILYLLTFLAHLLGGKRGYDLFSSRDEILRALTTEGSVDLGRFEREVVHRIFRFGEKKARDVMVPLTRVIALSEKSSLKAALEVLEAHGYSRYPIFRDRVDNIVGIFDVASLVRSTDKTPFIAPLVQPAHYVPEGMPVEEVLAALRTGGGLVVVVDEYGGAVGILTLEDIFEEVVGEIEDGLLPPTRDITKIRGGWEVVGTCHLDLLREKTGLSLPAGDYETVAGFVLETAGRIPSAGEQILTDGLMVEILAASPRRILRVAIKVTPKSSSTDD